MSQFTAQDVINEIQEFVNDYYGAVISSPDLLMELSNRLDECQCYVDEQTDAQERKRAWVDMTRGD